MNDRYPRLSSSVRQKRRQFAAKQIKDVLAKCSVDAFAIGRSADVLRGLYDYTPAIQILDPISAVPATLLAEHPGRDSLDFSGGLRLQDLSASYVIFPNAIIYSRVICAEFEVCRKGDDEAVVIVDQDKSRYLGFHHNHTLIKRAQWDINESRPDSPRSVAANLLESKLLIESDLPTVWKLQKFLSSSPADRLTMIQDLRSEIANTSNPSLFEEQLQCA